MKLRPLFLLILAGIVVLPVASEELTPLRKAQQLAFSGQREQARALCREILERAPGDLDVRILLARTLAWDKRYVEARRELHDALARRPDYVDASRALADVDLWDRRPDRALAVCEAGLRHHPQDFELRYRQSRALENLDRVDEAYALARSLREESPDDERVAKLAERLRLKTMTHEAQLGYRYEDFREFSDPWQEWNVSVTFRESWGSIIPRVRHARRFGKTAEQFEVDAYPRLPWRTYAYLNFGLSGDSPFPRRRYGAELYKSFGGGWEASAGLRRLEFGGEPVRIYTGSLGKYWGNYWVSARPTITRKSSGNSDSASLRLRRYFGTSETWLGVEISTGDRPALDLAGFEQGRLDAARQRVEGQIAFGRVWALSGSLGLRRQEVDPGRKRRSSVFSLSLSRMF